MRNIIRIDLPKCFAKASPSAADQDLCLDAYQHHLSAVLTTPSVIQQPYLYSLWGPYFASASSSLRTLTIHKSSYVTQANYSWGCIGHFQATLGYVFKHAMSADINCRLVHCGRQVRQAHSWKAVLSWRGMAALHCRCPVQNMQGVEEAKKWLFEEFYKGRIQAWIHTFKGLDSVNKATDFMLSGQSTGKVVVDLRWLPDSLCFSLDSNPVHSHSPSSQSFLTIGHQIDCMWHWL